MNPTDIHALTGHTSDCMASSISSSLVRSFGFVGAPILSSASTVPLM